MEELSRFMLYSLNYRMVTTNQRTPTAISNSGIFKYRLIRWFIYIGIVILIDQYAGVDQTFIYFQF